jgi:hypothetical protein
MERSARSRNAQLPTAIRDSSLEILGNEARIASLSHARHDEGHRLGVTLS